MVPLLVLIALGFAGAGLLAVTPATLGVYFACVGCLFGILARMRQSHEQHVQPTDTKTP